MPKAIHLLYYLLIVLLFSCASESQKVSNRATEKLIPKYAKGFSIEYIDGYKTLTIHQAWKNGDGSFAKPIQYILLKKGQIAPQNLSSFVQIQVPIQKIICLSTTHIPFVAMLGESEKIVGISGCKYISNPIIKNSIKLGKIQEVGQENGINLEIILNLQPDAVMAYSMGESDNSYQQLLRAGLKVALNSEYLEETPLGKAEWIKFVAAFFDKEQQADSIFDEIEKSYLATSQLAAHQPNKPTAFLNIPYGNIWYMAGGKSFAAKLLADAGATYILAKDTTSGSLQMSIEAVFQHAQKADFWLNVSNFNTLQELKNMDTRFMEFAALQKGNIFNNNNKVNENGGIEYWELGIARPDIVLKDLVKVFHPNLLPDDEMYFYKKLE